MSSLRAHKEGPSRSEKGVARTQANEIISLSRPVGMCGKVATAVRPERYTALGEVDMNEPEKDQERREPDVAKGWSRTLIMVLRRTVSGSSSARVSGVLRALQA
jgi:hypothetical protein